MTPRQIRALRKEKGHSQAEAADLCGVSRCTWNRWERGKQPPDPARLELYRRGQRVKAA